MKNPAQYWLMKSEPESYGIEHLKADRKTAWTGVRNFQARNYMQQMHIGDDILFYHSSCKVPGVYGTAKVASLPYPDATQFDPKSRYYEPRARKPYERSDLGFQVPLGCATKEKPVWFLVDIAFVKKFKEPYTLTDIRSNRALRAMMILQLGSRLSVTPVAKEHFIAIIKRA